MHTPFTVTKFINERGCGQSTGWDGAHLDGLHVTGHPLRVSISRQMDYPTFVRWESSVDGARHVRGTLDDVAKDALESTFRQFWDQARNAPGPHRQAI